MDTTDSMIRWQNRPKGEWFDVEMESLFQPIMCSVPDPREHPDSGKVLSSTVRPQYFYKTDAGRTVLRVDRKLLALQFFGRGEIFYPLGGMVIALTWAYERDLGIKIKFTEEEPDTLVVPQWFVDVLKALGLPTVFGFAGAQMLLGKLISVGVNDEDFYLVRSSTETPNPE